MGRRNRICVSVLLQLRNHKEEQRGSESGSNSKLGFTMFQRSCISHCLVAFGPNDLTHACIAPNRIQSISIWRHRPFPSAPVPHQTLAPPCSLGLHEQWSGPPLASLRHPASSESPHALCFCLGIGYFDTLFSSWCSDSRADSPYWCVDGNTVELQVMEIEIRDDVHVVHWC
jgi:hypothetical protein